MTSDEQTVASGYDLVYATLPESDTFRRTWQSNAAGADYPEGFEHISFATVPELRAMADDLRLGDGATLVDLACGMGGPGLWIARETDAALRGIDASAVAVKRAGERAARLGMTSRARFSVGTFGDTRLAAASADGAMSIDALQYAPDKRAALGEAARILRPGGRLAFACFELEPERVAGLPVLGADPVADYRPLLEQAGFDVLRYDESAGWLDRLTTTYQAVIDAREPITREIGEPAFLALYAEIALTLQVKPYRSRVLASAVRG